jgi:hypothetical protein
LYFSDIRPLSSVFLLEVLEVLLRNACMTVRMAGKGGGCLYTALHMQC